MPGCFRWFGEDKPVAEVARAAVLAGADAVVLADRDEARTLAMICSVREALPEARLDLRRVARRGSVRG